MCGVMYFSLLLHLLSYTMPSVSEVQLQNRQQDRFLSQCVTGQEMEARVFSPGMQTAYFPTICAKIATRWQGNILPVVGNTGRYICSMIDRYNRNAN
jgi:hypothetical protein